VLIGISGKPRRGKDSLAKAVADDFNFTVVHFADALYEEIQLAHTITHTSHWSGDWVTIDLLHYTSPMLCRKVGEWFKHAEATQNDRKGVFGRCVSGDAVFLTYINHAAVKKDPLMLQWWGTEYRRCHFGMNYWVEKTAERVQRLSNTTSSSMIDRRIIVADVRFKNEAYWVKAQDDGRLIRINSSEPFEPTGRDDSHPSETDLDDYQEWDEVIDNDYNELFFVIGLSVVDRWLDEDGRRLA